MGDAAAVVVVGVGRFAAGEQAILSVVRRRPEVGGHQRVGPVAVEVVGVPFGDGAVGGDGDESSAQVVGVGLLDGRAAGRFGLVRLRRYAYDLSRCTV